MQALDWFSNELPVDGGDLELPTYNFPEGVVVQIKIENLVAVGSDSRAPYVNAPSLSLDAKGIWVGGVYNTCYVAAYVSYPTSPGPRTTFTPGNGCTYPRSMANYVDTGLVRGAGTAVRVAKIPLQSVPCDTIVCHTYDGSQTVTITPLAGDLDFMGTYGGARKRTLFVPPFVNAAGAYSGPGYYQVVFTDSTSPRGLPAAAIQKNWIYGDATAPGHPFWHKTNILECGNPITLLCAIYVKESGIMASTTRVNGVDHTDSAAVQCAVNEPTLNLPAVRAAMLDAADSTHGSATNLNLRREQVAAVFRNRVSGAITVVTAVQDSSNRCFSWWHRIPPDQVDPNDSIVAYIHTHPTVAGETYGCPGGRSSANRIPGPSSYDSTSRANVNGHSTYIAAGWDPTWYIMAMDHVYKMDATNSPASHRSIGKWWGNGLCAWLRFPDKNDRIYRLH